MRSVTGIELGPDSCVLVRVRSHRDTLRVSAVHGTEAGESPAEASLASHLREVRRRKRFPRRARVVAWGLHEAASAADAATRAALAPVADAGFRIDDVMTPAAALAVLAARRPAIAGRDAIAWLSINRHGTAIAIVAGSRLLFSREFSWTYRQPRTTREELLQRYSLVAHVAPELRHAIDAVREEHGARVDGVVICGDLPDLRSLTMPLIDELDMEVETLDSLEGIDIVPPAAAEELAHRAPAIRLASAAAAGAPRVLEHDERRPPAWAAVAAAVLLALGAWAAVGYMSEDPPSPAAAPGPASPAAERRAPAAPSSASPVSPPSPAPAAETRPPDDRAGVRSVSPPPLSNAGADERTGPPAVRSREAGSAATMGQSTPGPTEPGVPDVRQETMRSPGRTLQPAARLPAPLEEPLPAVNSILVSPDRKLAVLDGEIVREGESIGRRVVVRIEPGAVLLREPSGLERRVTMRRRIGPGSRD